MLNWVRWLYNNRPLRIYAAMYAAYWFVAALASIVLNRDYEPSVSSIVTPFLVGTAVWLFQRWRAR